MPIVVVLPLRNPLIVPSPHFSDRRRRDHRRSWEGFRRRLAVQLVALPLDFADALAALAPDVFGDFDEAEDVFLRGCQSSVMLREG